MTQSDSGGAAMKIGVALLAAIVAIVAVVVVVIGGGALCAPNSDTVGADTAADGAGMPGQKVMPMKKGTYQLTSPFGMRSGTMHQGQDFGSTPNQPIYAAFDGVVDKAGAASGFGQWIVLNHNVNGQKVATVYGHMFPDGVLVHAGQKVTAGQQIAKVGYNGQVDPAGPGGAHLHFEVWKGGWGAQAVDPMPWLAGAVEPGSAAARPSAPNTNSDPSIVSAADWNKIAQHESGGNWAINSGNGFYGGLQFSSSTWTSFGGVQYAATADKATPPQQMEVANKVLASQGWDAWPTTSRQTGVRNKKPAPAGTFVAAPSLVANITTSPSAPRAPPTTTPPGGLSSVTDSGGTLDISRPMNARFGSEAHFQTNTVRLVRAVAQRFPQLQTIGGWRADGGGYSDHPDGRAADIMIPNWSSAEGKALGDTIQRYVMDNKQVFRVDYTIWRQRYTAATGDTNILGDRGGSTANHYDHVHVTVLTSPKYSGQDLGSITDRGQTGGGTTECNGGGADRGSGDGAPLKKGTVPQDWARWYVKAGGICREVTSSLLAAQGHQESRFSAQATSDQGAKGPGQFMDYTWPTWAKDYDGDGKIDVRSPGDAIMAQGHFMCYMVGRFRKARIKEPARGGIAALALAGYNAGEGAVEQYGGIPPYAQTIHYVDVILTNEPGYRALSSTQSADLAGVN